MHAPATYFYIDVEGVHSLYAQSVGNPEIEKSTKIEKEVKGKGGVNAKLKHIVLKLISGADFEANAEISGSRKSVEESKKVVRIENELELLMTAIEQMGEPAFFSTLSAAAHHVESKKSKVFVSVQTNFNAPQLRGHGSGKSILEDGYLLLEKGMGDDYDDRDDYYKNPSVPLSMRLGSAHIGLTGHFVRYIQGHHARNVPLSVFGAMFYTPEYFQIKPYAIWI